MQVWLECGMHLCIWFKVFQLLKAIPGLLQGPRKRNSSIFSVAGIQHLRRLHNAGVLVKHQNTHGPRLGYIAVNLHLLHPHRHLQRLNLCQILLH
jgi:hypothetical protein